MVILDFGYNHNYTGAGLVWSTIIVFFCISLCIILYMSLLSTNIKMVTVVLSCHGGALSCHGGGGA